MGFSLCNKFSIEKEADYVFSLKGNQGNLFDDVKTFFEFGRKEKFRDTEFDYHEELNKEHGRIEIRKCWISSQTDWIDQKERWKGFNSIAMIESTRTIKRSFRINFGFLNNFFDSDRNLIYMFLFRVSICS